MSEALVSSLSPRERRDLAAHAERAGISIGEMALAFLKAHLLLTRDCRDLLPDRSTGKHGVSLGGGNGKA